MGDAKRRKLAYDEAKRVLLSSINGEAYVVGESALALFEKFVLPNRYSGGCYFVTMVLFKFFADEHNIKTVPVLGYVNDGTDDIMISHAWLEHNGLKVDLTLSVTDQSISSTGDLIVLDQTIRPGRLSFSYHLERSSTALFEVQRLMEDPLMGPLARHKEEEHQSMLARFGNPSLMQDYIKAAPANMSYAAMTVGLPKSMV